MNIFFLDTNPIIAAQLLADKHIVKMQVEAAQMLSTAHWMTGSCAPYKACYINHPCNKWIRESLDHYLWVAVHGIGICYEYEKRYNKVHKTKEVLEWLYDNTPNLPLNDFSVPPLCMPDQYKSNNTIKSYRDYYLHEKIIGKNLTYKNMENIPSWAFVPMIENQLSI